MLVNVWTVAAVVFCIVCVAETACGSVSPSRGSLIPQLAPAPRHGDDTPDYNGSRLTTNTATEAHRPITTTPRIRMRHAGDNDAHDGHVDIGDIKMKGVAGWIVGAIVVLFVCSSCYAGYGKMAQKRHSKSTYQCVQTMPALINVGVIRNTVPPAPYPCQAPRAIFISATAPPPYEVGKSEANDSRNRMHVEEVGPYPQERPPPYPGKNTDIMMHDLSANIVVSPVTNIE